MTETRLPELAPAPYRGGRKPVIRPAAEAILRKAERPLSVADVHERIGRSICSTAGVHSAMWRLMRDGKIERVEKRTTFGEYGATYRWVSTPARAALDAVTLTARKAEIGRLGGLKSGAARRNESRC